MIRTLRTTGRNDKQPRPATSRLPSRSLPKDKKVVVQSALNRSSTRKSFKFTTGYHSPSEEAIVTVIWYWFTCSAISKYMRRLNGQWMNVRRTTTEKLRHTPHQSPLGLRPK